MVRNEIFISEIPCVILKYPKLRAKTIRENIILAGTVDLITEDGELVDSYDIEIHPTNDYPNKYPLVFETTGKRFPFNIDWHVYPDGHWCISVPIEEAIECSQGITLMAFIEKQVCGFLFNQTFRRKNGYFYKERSHGLLGRIEFYKEFLCVKPEKLLKALIVAASAAEPKSNSKCFCGSDSKFRKCHRRIIRKIKKYRKIVTRDVDELKEALQKIAVLKKLL